MTQGSELFELCNAVRDRESFLAFVQALQKDRRLSVDAESKNPSSPYGPAALGWENTSIEAYLEGAAAWLEASAEDARDLAGAWQLFAKFLHCGKIYE